MYEQPKTVQARRRSLARSHNSSTDHGSSDHTGVRATAASTAHGAQLAGHLAALISATGAVRRATEDPAGRAELDAALGQLTARTAELTPAGAPSRPAVPTTAGKPLGELHEHAHDLAGRLLVVAAAQQDTVTAMLAWGRQGGRHGARYRTTPPPPPP